MEERGREMPNKAVGQKPKCQERVHSYLRMERDSTLFGEAYRTKYILARNKFLCYVGMGFILPSPESPMEQARVLIAQKDGIESQIETHLSILKANNVTMNTPLVDPEGFPRADIDIYAVRNARVRIIELRNDLDAIMKAISKALEGIFDPALVVTQSTTEATPVQDVAPLPFARVDGVAPGSPAAEAVRIPSASQ